MHRIGRWFPAGLVLCALAVPGPAWAQLPRVMIQTDLGSMEVELDTVGAPETAGNFLRYVDHGAYQGGRFHRSVRAERQAEGTTEIEGIQGGLNPSRPKDVAPMALNDKKDTGLSLGDKAISRPPDGVDEPTADFFIRVGDQPELGRLAPDGKGFTPFGHVVRGREVARLIHTARAQDGRLNPPIGIVGIKRVR
jgi:peptidyl-prolyl cis-trans isomerase A (cyclophilin A)